MQSPILTSVPLASIVWDNPAYFFRFCLDDNRLTVSLSQTGMLSAPGVIEREGRYVILYGFKRLHAWQRLGHTTVMANCYAYGLSSSEIAELIMADNQAAAFHPLEQVQLCALIAGLTGLSSREMLQTDIASRMGLSLSLKYFEFAQRMPRLDQRVKQAWWEGYLSTEKVMVLAALNPDEQEAVCAALIASHTDLSKSAWQELADILRDLGRLHKETWAQALAAPEIAAITLHKGLTPQQKGEHVLKQLRCQRYPRLMQALSQFETEKGRLLAPFPQQASVAAAPYFEGEDLTLSLRAKDEPELASLCRHYLEAAEHGELARIFRIIHGHNTD
jgi:hypothetical protein